MVGEQLALTALMGVFLVAVAGFLARMEDWRSYTPLAGGSAIGDAGYGGHAEKPAGIVRWFTTVDHKDIGILYGIYALIAFFWGGAAVLLMRAELAAPGFDIMQAQFYNSLLTSHGITMLFLFGTPIIAGSTPSPSGCSRREPSSSGPAFSPRRSASASTRHRPRGRCTRPSRPSRPTPGST
jgi:cytochrome c oxidase subunit 1